jgi:hypothetical protein
MKGIAMTDTTSTVPAAEAGSLDLDFALDWISGGSTRGTATSPTV